MALIFLSSLRDWHHLQRLRWICRSAGRRVQSNFQRPCDGDGSLFPKRSRLRCFLKTFYVNTNFCRLRRLSVRVNPDVSATQSLFVESPFNLQLPFSTNIGIKRSNNHFPAGSSGKNWQRYKNTTKNRYLVSTLKLSVPWLLYWLWELGSFLQQLHSRAQLETSEESVNFLLRCWDALPEYLHILSAFTMEDGPCNLDRSDFYADTRIFDNEKPGQFFILRTEKLGMRDLGWSAKETDILSVTELCYLLKYVELNDRNGTSPWSVRQMGVYQQFHVTSRQGRCILIQPSSDLQRRMREEFEENANCTNYIDYWFSFHLLCVSTLNRNWLSYIKFLEKKISAIVRTHLCLNITTFFFPREKLRLPHSDYSIVLFDSPSLTLSETATLHFSISNLCTISAISCIEQHMRSSPTFRSSMHWSRNPEISNCRTRPTWRINMRHSKKNWNRLFESRPSCRAMLTSSVIAQNE